MGWDKYARSAYGALSSMPFVENNFGFTINESGWQAFHANDSGSEFSNGGEGVWLEWTPGQDWSRKPLFYFYRVDGNGDPIGLIGFDADVTCGYTVLGHNAEVIVRLYLCTRDLNHILVQDFVSETIGSSAISTSSYDGFALKFFFNIGKTADTNKIVLGANLEIYNATRSGVYDSEWSWAGVLSGNTQCNDVTYDTTKESPEFGKPAKKKGGYNKTFEIKGSFDDHSDTITPTDAPLLGASNMGFVNVYGIDKTSLVEVADELFPPIIDILSATINRNLMDYVVGCKIIPCHINGTGVNSVNVGWKTIRVTGDCRIADSDYVEKDLGYISVDEYWANFLDFSGCRAKLYLPFYGFVDVDPEFWNGFGAKLQVKYRINTVDGSFIAQLIASSSKSELSNSLIGEYSGKCSMDVPITGIQYGNMMMRGMNELCKAAFSEATGNGAGTLSALGNLASLKPDIPKSNGYVGNAAFMGHRRPFLLIERCEAQFSEKYPDEVGLPLEMQGILGDFTGLTVASHAHLDHIPCTKEEKELISKYLAEGIIL